MTDDDKSSNTGKADKITSATVSTGTSANSEVNVRLADLRHVHLVKPLVKKAGKPEQARLAHGLP